MNAVPPVPRTTELSKQSHAANLCNLRTFFVVLRSSCLRTWSVPFFCLLASASWLLPAHAATIPQADIDNPRCFSCHAQSHIAEIGPDERAQMTPGTQPADRPAKRPALFVNPDKLHASIHAAVACTSCHPDANQLPHKPQLASPTCNSTGCHNKEANAFMQGSHALAAARGNKNAPTCATCHGAHDILKKDDRNARTHPLNIVKVCADCHETHVTKTRNNSDGTREVSSYLESVHGRGVLKSGLTVAATCADCHGAHDVRPSSDPLSPVNRNHVPTTCGRCHVGITEMYAKSIHGEKLAEQIALQNAGVKDLNSGLRTQDSGLKPPVCSDCHTAHAISRTNDPAFVRDIVSECGTCHDRPMPGSREKRSLYETYRESYHGQVTNLGYNRAARCSDCHGAHDIRRIDDVNSPLNDKNKLRTCQKCHKGADVKFASFAPHADFRNGDRYPILHYVFLYFVIMMSASFGFFGLHCVAWAVRSGIERIKHGPHPKPNYSKVAIQRFNRVDRINHAFVIISFFGLTLTGLPLLYSDKAWGQTLAAILGGPRTCGFLHKYVFAVMLIANFVVHAVGVVRRFKKHGIRKMLFGPATMLFTRKDVADCIGMIKWFFRGGKKTEVRTLDLLGKIRLHRGSRRLPHHRNLRPLPLVPRLLLTLSTRLDVQRRHHGPRI